MPTKIYFGSLAKGVTFLYRFMVVSLHSEKGTEKIKNENELHIQGFEKLRELDAEEDDV